MSMPMSTLLHVWPYHPLHMIRYALHELSLIYGSSSHASAPSRAKRRRHWRRWWWCPLVAAAATVLPTTEEADDECSPEKRQRLVVSSACVVVYQLGSAADAASCKAVGLAWLHSWACLLYTSPSPRDRQKSRMPSSA